MNDREIIRNAIDYIQILFKDAADGHDANHSLRVYYTAVSIAEKHKECDVLTVALAAILHDVDDHKLFNTENNANARIFLAENGVDEVMTEIICDIINAVSFSQNRDKKPETIEAMIVQDADRLDAMGAIGIARTFAYGGKNGRPLESSVQHFHDKLLLLKDMMNTKEARRIAEERHAFLEAFLFEIESEMMKKPASGKRLEAGKDIEVEAKTDSPVVRLVDENDYMARLLNGKKSADGKSYKVVEIDGVKRIIKE